MNHALSLDTLKEVKGGVITDLFNKALAKAAADVLSDPTLIALRQVKLFVTIKPAFTKHKEFKGVTVTFKVGQYNPERVATMHANLELNPETQVAELKFEDLSPTNANQKSLPF